MFIRLVVETMYIYTYMRWVWLEGLEVGVYETCGGHREPGGARVLQKLLYGCRVVIGSGQGCSGAGALIWVYGSDRGRVGL